MDMGTWGVHSFENDSVCDWAYELEKQSNHDILEQAFKAVHNVDYLDSDEATCAIGAAEVVAALGGRPPAYMPESVRGWLKAHPAAPRPSLVQQARQALERILTPPNELLDLWEESDEIDSWKASVADLRARLGGPLPT